MAKHRKITPPARHRAPGFRRARRGLLLLAAALIIGLHR